jgi:hypothetical protein
MAKRRDTPREFVLISKPPTQIDSRDFPKFYALCQRAIFMSLERRGLITKVQLDAAFEEIGDMR